MSVFLFHLLTIFPVNLNPIFAFFATSQKQQTRCAVGAVSRKEIVQLLILKSKLVSAEDERRRTPAAASFGLALPRPFENKNSKIFFLLTTKIKTNTTNKQTRRRKSYSEDRNERK